MAIGPARSRRMAAAPFGARRKPSQRRSLRLGAAAPSSVPAHSHSPIGARDGVSSSHRGVAPSPSGSFLWCLWKVRNEFLFQRKKSMPHQVHIMELALNASMCNDNGSSILTSPAKQVDYVPHSSLVPPQGCTISSDLLIAGTKIFSDASWRNSKIPGRVNMQGTGVGIYIQVMEGQENCIIMMQASMDLAPSPLIAEAAALHLAAVVASKLQISSATFFTDNLTLAKSAAGRNIAGTLVRWDLRLHLAGFLRSSKQINANIFHISRSLNGVAHDCAHQALNSNSEPIFECVKLAHSRSGCPFIQKLASLDCYGFCIHAVQCY